MSDTRKIVVEILNKDIVESKQPIVVNSTTQHTEVNLTALLHPVRVAERHLLGKSVLVNQAYNEAKSSLKQGINLTMNRYFNMKEDYIGQNNFNNFMTGVSKIASFGTSLVGGAIAGAKVGGVYGAIGGAVIGSVGFGISEAIGYQGRMSGYYSTLNASNYQTQFGRTRAGLTDGGKGTEN